MKAPFNAMLTGVESPSLFHVCDLASGGMGRVEIAVRREAHFERLFAVKRLHPQFASDPLVRDMFLDEARIAGLIRHPNVVHVLDVGKDFEGPFLVMEYVEGLSLSEIVTHHVNSSMLIPISVGLEILRQVALGLQAAHELRDAAGRLVGLIHRDVSPQNVMVSYDGCARLTDFGIAKASERLTKTQTGILKGKYGYLSPEQLHFEEPAQSSDLFSLGVVLFEVLASRRLYGGGGLKAARRILNEPPPNLADHRPDVPNSIIDLVFRMLAKDPACRPSSAREVADSLKEGLRDLEDDDHVDVSDYMRTLFADRKKQRRAQIAEVLKNMEHTSRRRVVSVRPTPPRRNRRFLVGVLGLAAALSGGVVLSGVSSDDAPPVAIKGSQRPVADRILPAPVQVPHGLTEPLESATPSTRTTLPTAGNASARMRPRARMNSRRGREWQDEW